MRRPSNTLGGHKTYLIGACIQLVETAEGTVLTVCNPVIFQVTKEENTLALADRRHKGTGADRSSEECIRLGNIKAGLPDIVVVFVLQLHKLEQNGLVADELRIAAVWRFQAVVKI